MLPGLFILNYLPLCPPILSSLTFIRREKKSGPNYNGSQRISNSIPEVLPRSKSASQTLSPPLPSLPQYHNLQDHQNGFSIGEDKKPSPFSPEHLRSSWTASTVTKDSPPPVFNAADPRLVWPGNEPSITRAFTVSGRILPTSCIKCISYFYPFSRRSHYSTCESPAVSWAVSWGPHIELRHCLSFFQMLNMPLNVVHLFIVMLLQKWYLADRISTFIQEVVVSDNVSTPILTDPSTFSDTKLGITGGAVVMWNNFMEKEGANGKRKGRKRRSIKLLFPRSPLQATRSRRPNRSSERVRCSQTQIL